jgi:ABC-type transporter Mla subunit MlaD
MAQRNVTELAAGAVVLVVAIVFLGYAVVHTGHGDVGGYSLHADFDHIDGLTVGSDVRMAGVKVGNVTATSVARKATRRASRSPCRTTSSCLPIPVRKSPATACSAANISR